MTSETDSGPTGRGKEHRHKEVIPQSTTDALVRRGLLRSKVQGPARLLDMVEQPREKPPDDIFDQLSDEPPLSEGDEPLVDK